ncbi:probable WRKY transcription factor 40 [Hibiscus syriacus]|uniref:probable WRKY transcription factor 40 n=1 Tax=Hibiscus syriacus TaxID=106335 RepID=UPI001924B3D7|nr:probable WRKY transcription factor 40 [Hibiscus syriacus]
MAHLRQPSTAIHVDRAALNDVLIALGCSSLEQELKRVMEEIDIDKDGFINLSKFLILCRLRFDNSNAENKKLTEVLTVVCEHYTILQKQYKELVSKNIETESSKKKKAECEDYGTTMIGFTANAESSGSDENSFKKTKSSISERP